MTEILIFIALAIISYFIGCFSTAKLIAKYYKSINIYNVGTGHPDTQNIYHSVDKTLGILTGILDIGKMFFFLVLLDFLLCNPFLQEQIPGLCNIATQNYLLILGFVMVIGHCLPVTHGFKGGRGIFTYIGFVMFFAPWPMLIICLLSLFIVIKFKQYRFAQYIIVLLPPFLNLFFEANRNFIGKMFIAAFLMGVINIFVSKKLGEI